MVSGIPARVECPACGRMVTTASAKGSFMRHAAYPTGPECECSGQPVTQEAVFNTRHRARASTVMNWAHIMRDEDPKRVYAMIARTDRRELESLLLTALAGLDPSRSELELFGWVRNLV